jgi:hypothetical protein
MVNFAQAGKIKAAAVGGLTPAQLSQPARERDNPPVHAGGCRPTRLDPNDKRGALAAANTPTSRVLEVEEVGPEEL